MEEIRIEGAKLSQELITINLRYHARIENNLTRFYQNLSDNQISMQFLSTVHSAEISRIICCVDSEAGVFINTLMKSESALFAQAELIEPTGLLTLFPHHFNLKTLGLVLSIFGKASLSLYGAASSLSSLTFILNYHDLERAVEYLREKIDIPLNKIERRPKIQIKQTRMIKKDD